MTPIPTPGQTVGPFFHYALPYDGDSALVPRGAAGAVRLHGTVRDGAGEPVPDAILELWQADAAWSLLRPLTSTCTRPTSRLLRRGMPESRPVGFRSPQPADPAD